MIHRIFSIAIVFVPCSMVLLAYYSTTVDARPPIQATPLRPVPVKPKLDLVKIQQPKDYDEVRKQRAEKPELKPITLYELNDRTFEKFTTINKFGAWRGTDLRTIHDVLPEALSWGKRDHFALQDRDELVKTASPSMWRMTGLQLIGVVHKSEGVAYVISPGTKARIDTKVKPRTRPLDLFETEALAKIRSEKDWDVVALLGKDRIRMLGAIRANATCTKCHSVKEGTLLGTFTYDIIRVKD